MKARLFFAWYDMWIGAYWSAKDKILYICPLPMVVIAVTWQRCQGTCGKVCFAGDPDYSFHWCGECIPF